MIPSTVHVSPEVDDAVIVRLLEQGYRVVIAPVKEKAVVV